MKTGILKWSCGHTNSTDADREGYGLCLDCGAVFAKQLTQHIFEKQLAALKRQSTA